MKKFLLFFTVFYLAFVALMPKENLYYTLKNRLQAERITITEESLNNNLIALKSSGILVFYDGVESVEIESAKVSVFGFFNKVQAFNVGASKSLKNMFDFSADSVEISYVPWDYNRVNIHAKGDFGEINGKFEIGEQKIKLLIEPSGRFKKSGLLRQYFTKSEEGYIYESKIK